MKNYCKAYSKATRWAYDHKEKRLLGALNYKPALVLVFRISGVRYVETSEVILAWPEGGGCSMDLEPMMCPTIEA